MGSKECFEWFEQLDQRIEESDCVFGGIKRFLQRLTSDEDAENRGGGPALDRALYKDEGGRWDDMGQY